MIDKKLSIKPSTKLTREEIEGLTDHPTFLKLEAVIVPILPALICVEDDTSPYGGPL